MLSAAKVLIYNSSNLQCELLAASLESLRPGLEVRCICDCASMLTLLTADPSWVVVVSDQQHSEPLSILAQCLHSRFPGLPLVFVLQEGSTEGVIEALRLGAKGIVDSSDNLAQLVTCIDRVSRGQVSMKHVNLATIFDKLAQPRPRVAGIAAKTLLNPREEEISRLVAEGMSNREVSRTLSVTESTVKNTLFSVYEKLGVSNRVELTLRVSSNTGYL